MRVVDDLICDPAALIPGGGELDLSGLGIEVLEASWGEADIEVSTTETETGLLVTDRQAKPREPSLTLRIREEGDVDLPTAAWKVQAKLGEWQRRPGWLERKFLLGGKFAGSLACRVHKASIDGLTNWKIGQNDPVTFKFLTDGIWYATVEADSEEFSATDARHLVFELAEVLGTAPGLIRIRITNTGDEDWRAMIVAGESDEHPQDETAEPTAALHYACKDLTLRGGAEVKSGAVEAALHAGWLTILSSEIDEVGHMTHQGVRFPWLRAEDLGSVIGDVELRARWRSLGAFAWETNRAVAFPVVDDEQLLDLRECRPQPAVLGGERWELEIQGRARSGAGKVRLLDLYPLPDKLVVVRTPDLSAEADLTIVKDAGTIATSGSNASWSSSAAAAKSSDNSRTSAKVSVTPTAEKQTNPIFATKLGLALSGDVTITRVDALVEARLKEAVSGAFARLRSYLVIGGEIVAQLNSGFGSAIENDTTDRVYSVGGLVEPGLVTPAEANAEGFGVAVAAFHGSLGGMGIIPSVTVEIDQVAARIYCSEGGDENCVCFQSRSIEFRSDGIYRQHPTEDVWGRLVPEKGGNPKATPSGFAQRASRWIVIPSVGDLGDLPDSSAVDLEARSHVRAGYHLAREAGE